MKNLVLFFMLCFVPQSIQGQRIEPYKLKNWQLLGYAKSSERVGDLYSAIDYYQEYVRRKPENIKYAQKLAELYYQSKNYKKAQILFEKIIKSDKKKQAVNLFYYAEILKTGQKYDSALVVFLECRNILANDKRNIYSYLTNIEMEGCQIALKNPGMDQSIEIKHLNNTINKVNLESSPLIYNDSTLIYSSLKLDTIPVVSSNEDSLVPVNRFYSAKLKNSDWIGGLAAPEPFYNFENQHTSNGVFSLDKQRFYFTSARKNWKNQIIGTLYVSHKIRGKWQKPVKLDQEVNLKKYTSTQPALGVCYDKDYEVIYFISNRPGGWGGMDIWYTVYDLASGQYKKPINAGGYINTPGDEITPYYDINDSILYFSSNGLPGYGGYDIFKSKGWLVNWEKAENAGKPLNSSYDDIYFKKQTNINQGFIVSNRDGALFSKNPNCCYDIFEFSARDYLNSDNENLITDNNNLLYNNEPDGITRNAVVPEDHTKTDHSEKDEKKKIISEIKNNIAFNQNTNPSEEKFILNPVNGSDNDSENTIVTGNIYFEFNKSDLTEESKEFIDTTLFIILEKYQKIVVEIGAHTDNIGDDDYNFKLSVLRAQSVVYYLTQKGINKDRMIPVGYGKTKPLFLPYNPDGSDNPKAREKNRRIEFKILKISS